MNFYQLLNIRFVSNTSLNRSLDGDIVHATLSIALATKARQQ